MSQQLQSKNFADWVERYLVYLRTERQLAPRTILTRRIELRRFRDFLRNEKIAAGVQRLHVRQYVALLARRDLSPRTINHLLVTLRTFF